MINGELPIASVDFSRMRLEEFKLHGALSSYGRGVFRYVEHISLPEGLLTLKDNPDVATPYQILHIKGQRNIEGLISEYEIISDNDKVLSDYAFNYGMFNNTLETAELMLQMVIPGFKSTIDRRMEIDPLFRQKKVSELSESELDVI